MAYGKNKGLNQGPLTAQDAQDVTLPGFSKGESPHTNHPGTSYINTAKKISKREGPLTLVDHNNSAIIDEYHAMSWIEKMERFNKVAFFEFLRTLSITYDEFEEAKKEGEERLIQLIQRNNEAMDVKRLKEYLEEFELRANTLFLDDWEKLRNQAMWYQQAIAKEYVKLFNEHNIFLNEFHSVLDGIINDSSFKELPGEAQEKLIKARDDLKAYMDEDNSEDLRILSESCLNDDGSINEEKIEKQKKSLERIKRKIKKVDDIYHDVLKTIGKHNSAATTKLQEVRERYEQKAAPILTEIQRLEVLQRSIELQKDMKIKDIASKCIGTVKALKDLENNNDEYLGDEYTEIKREIRTLRELIEKSVGSMLKGEVSPSEYQRNLLFIQEKINNFYDDHKEKSFANNLKVDAMVVVQTLRSNLTKVLSKNKKLGKSHHLNPEDSPSHEGTTGHDENYKTKPQESFSQKKTEQSGDAAAEPTRESPDISKDIVDKSPNEEHHTQKTTNLKEELKGIYKECEQRNPEDSHQELPKEEARFDNTMMELIEGLEEEYHAVFKNFTDNDFTEITDLLDQYKELELTMSNILELEENLMTCIGHLNEDKLEIRLHRHWKEEKQGVIEDFDLSPNGPSP